MSDDRRPRLSVDNCLKSRAEMTALFADIPEALRNTIEIAQALFRRSSRRREGYTARRLSTSGWNTSSTSSRR
jgi:DNA polymerase III alpha subunit